MLEYEVGAIPSRPLTIIVTDELDNPVNVVGYDSWRLEIRDTNDDEVDMTGVNVFEIPAALGAFSVQWPRDRTLFPEKGKYVLRLVLENADGTRDITRVGEIRVREFGRIK